MTDIINVEEMFALPIGMHQVADFEGIGLHTSESLKMKFLAALAKNKKTKKSRLVL